MGNRGLYCCCSAGSPLLQVIVVVVVVAVVVEGNSCSTKFFRSLDKEEEYVHAAPDQETDGRKERSVV